MSADSEAPAQESLRERKARRTRRAIHEAAVDLAYEHGLEAATVAEIADRAGVSQRTFFNYFPSKEDAVVGTTDSLLEDGVVENLMAEADLSGCLVTAMARVIARIFMSEEDDAATAQKRRTVVYREPHLLQRRGVRNWRLERILVDCLVQRAGPRLADYDTPAGTSPEGVARTIIHLASVPLLVTASHHQAQCEANEDLAVPPPPFDDSLELFTAVMKGPRQ